MKWCLVMASERILGELVDARHNRYLDGRSGDRIRPGLGKNMDLTICQVQLVGALSLRKAIGVALFESGKEFTKYMGVEGMASNTKTMGDHGLSEFKTLEEARNAAEFIVLQSMDSRGDSREEFCRNEIN